MKEATTPIPENIAVPPFSAPLHERLYPFFLVALSFLLYGNTIFNEYVLDDGLVITENKFTQNGIAGIPDILTKDTFYGALGPTAEVAGGRYRPLSVVTFALEQEVFHGNPHISHAINVLLFACTVVLLYGFLRRTVFPEQAVATFLATLLFAIHPIHTEVVANIKSRDEILAFLFIILTMILLFRFHREKRKFVAILVLIGSAASYGLALFSKENGIVYLAIIPMSLFFFGGTSMQRSLHTLAPFVLVAAAWTVVRLSVIEARQGEIAEVLNAAYLYASTEEKFATIILVLGKYLGLLLFPHPLSYDYSYNQIPYTNFANPFVWLSLLVHLALVVAAIVLWKRKSVVSFAILFYFVSISIISNVVVDIGAPMGERLLYQPSLGFCMAVAAITGSVYQQNHLASLKSARVFGFALLATVFALAAYKTITRNADWRNMETLLLKDVEVSPNSASANRRAALALIKLSEQDTSAAGKMEYLRRAIAVLEKAIRIHPQYGDGYLALGVAYSRLDEVERAEDAWNRARALNATNYLPPDYENYLKVAYFNKGVRAGGMKQFDEARSYLLKSIHYDSTNAEAWYFLGGAYISLGDRERARGAWEKALTLNPNDRQAADRLKELAHK